MHCKSVLVSTSRQFALRSFIYLEVVWSLVEYGLFKTDPLSVKVFFWCPDDPKDRKLHVFRL